MVSTDRDAFDKELAVLFGAFNAFMTDAKSEAYWRGLEKMHVSTFTRCVQQAIGEEGEEKLPNVNRIWQISRELRNASRPVQRPGKQEQPAGDRFTCYGNRVLLAYFRRHGGASIESLRKMIREKNRVCDAYRSICTEEPEASLELLDKLNEAFDRTFERMPADELAVGMTSFHRHGHLGNLDRSFAEAAIALGSKAAA